MLAAVCCVGEGLTDDAISLNGVKCVVKPTAAVKHDVSLDYRGGKIYFCCEGCRRTFEKESDKFSARANLQLVQTKQAQQAHCPMSGQECSGDSKIAFLGTEVAFCCDGCKSHFEDATADEKLELAFGNKAFEKAFKMIGGLSSTVASESPTFVNMTVRDVPSNSPSRVGESTIRTRPSGRMRLFRRR